MSKTQRLVNVSAMYIQMSLLLRGERLADACNPWDGESFRWKCDENISTLTQQYWFQRDLVYSEGIHENSTFFIMCVRSWHFRQTCILCRFSHLKNLESLFFDYSIEKYGFRLKRLWKRIKNLPMFSTSETWSEWARSVLVTETFLPEVSLNYLTKRKTELCQFEISSSEIRRAWLLPNKW